MEAKFYQTIYKEIVKIDHKWALISKIRIRFPKRDYIVTDRSSLLG